MGDAKVKTASLRLGGFCIFRLPSSVLLYQYGSGYKEMCFAGELDYFKKA
ncbi:hypothetical protein [Zhongshania sp.]